jgi:hypothetical protein
MATRVAGEQYYKLTGQLFEIARQLQQKDGYPYDLDLLSGVLQNCTEGVFPGLSDTQSYVIRHAGSIVDDFAPDEYRGKLARYKLTGQLFEIARQLRQKSGYPYNPKSLSMILQACIEGNFSILKQKWNLINGYFTPISEQITRLKELNTWHNWGFSDADFDSLARSVPEWPDGNLIAVSLVPYLPGEDGVVKTFHHLWASAGDVYDHTSSWERYKNKDAEQLRLIEGSEHPAKEKPILRWEVIDLGSNRGQKFAKMRNPKTSPHAGILASVALHPEWIKAMDGGTVPYVWIPGYQNVSAEFPWRGAPGINTYKRRTSHRVKHCVDLGLIGSCSHHESWAVPSFVQEPASS